MNKSMTALLVIGLAGTVSSRPTLASPGFLDEAWMVAGNDKNQDRREERDPYKQKQQSGKKKQEQIENEREGRGYGYGYERRNPDKYDDGRRRR